MTISESASEIQTVTVTGGDPSFAIGFEGVFTGKFVSSFFQLINTNFKF